MSLRSLTLTAIPVSSRIGFATAELIRKTATYSIADSAARLTMLFCRHIALILVCSTSLFAFSDPRALEREAANDRDGDTFQSAYSIPGLPQHDFLLNQNYPEGVVIAIKFKGTRAYLIKPRERIDSQRRWIWIAPLWVAFRSLKHGDSHVRFYVEQALQAGFHVAGLDVGTTCGSPKGAELYDEFYTWVVKTHQLHPKVRLFGQSNGGLISYAWAFRHPEHVERIFGIYPVTDIRTWPKLEKVCGPERITPTGLGYPYKSVEELQKHLSDVNPVDNLSALASRGVPIFHIHGDADDLVPMYANSTELMNRYRTLGGKARVDVLKGSGHGGQQFFRYQPAADFLTEK